jgi:hypothetical protein
MNAGSPEIITHDERRDPSTGSTTTPTLRELSLIAQAFAPRLLDGGPHDVLPYLNSLTEHRFTGVYRFEPGWVVSVALFDRENPSLRVGDDVKMKESYCWLTGLGGASYVIEDACTDARLAGHAARESVRSYIAVLLRDKRGRPWGTLCHFDFRPRGAAPGTRERLEIFRPLIEEMFVRDTPARWDPDAPSNRRCVRVDALDGREAPPHLDRPSGRLTARTITRVERVGPATHATRLGGDPCS